MSEEREKVRCRSCERASDCCINRDHPQTDQRTLVDFAFQI
jgi:hypothetical protein